MSILDEIKKLEQEIQRKQISNDKYYSDGSYEIDKNKLNKLKSKTNDDDKNNIIKDKISKFEAELVYFKNIDQAGFSKPHKKQIEETIDYYNERISHYNNLLKTS